jgi:hypothetical protein
VFRICCEFQGGGSRAWNQVWSPSECEVLSGCRGGMPIQMALGGKKEFRISVSVSKEANVDWLEWRVLMKLNSSRFRLASGTTEYRIQPLALSFVAFCTGNCGLFWDFQTLPLWHKMAALMTNIILIFRLLLVWINSCMCLFWMEWIHPRVFISCFAICFAYMR